MPGVWAWDTLGAMRLRSLVRVSSLVLVALGLSGGTSARADDTPVVNVVPFAAARADGAENLLLDRQLPASREFLFRLPMPKDVDDASAALLIWPEAESPTACAAPPQGDARQFYTLGMVLRGTDAGRYLEAKVPPLQVGQPFCFQVKPQLAMSSAQLQAVAESAATALLTQLKGGASCFDGTSLPAFEQALKGSVEALGLSIGEVSTAALLALNRYIVNETDQCRRFSVSFPLLRPLSEQRVNLELGVSAQEAKLSGLPSNLPPLSSPLVMTAAGQVVPATDLLVLGSSDQVLQDAANQLRGRQNGIAGWGPVLLAWADALELLGRAAPDKKQETLTSLRKQVQEGQLPAPPTFELWDGTAFVPPAAFLKRRSPDSERLAKGTVARIPDDPKSETAETRKAWLTTLDSLVRARDGLRQAEASYQSREEETQQAASALRTVLTAAFSADDVRKQLRIQVRTVTAGLKAGSGETPSQANYASVDLGAVLAFTKYDTWFLPYVGLNVYLVPVDRTVAPSQLTGTWANRVLWQRLSVTIGVSLSAPTTPGLGIEAPFLSRYPLAALGYRIGTYSRGVAGVVFYKQQDANPLSGNKELKAAPFVGASLDIDLVHLLSKAL